VKLFSVVVNKLYLVCRRMRLISHKAHKIQFNFIYTKLIFSDIQPEGV
jgi:hypothetical protein